MYVQRLVLRVDIYSRPASPILLCRCWTDDVRFLILQMMMPITTAWSNDPRVGGHTRCQSTNAWSAVPNVRFNMQGIHWAGYGMGEGGPSAALPGVRVRCRTKSVTGNRKDHVLSCQGVVVKLKWRGPTINSKRAGILRRPPSSGRSLVHVWSRKVQRKAKALGLVSLAVKQQPYLAICCVDVTRAEHVIFGAG